MHSFSFSVRAMGAFALTLIPVMSLVAAEEGSATRGPWKSARMNCGARVECITRGGVQRNTHAAVFITNDDSVSCDLSEGDTTFVVALPHPFTLERLKFVNENVAARGTLSIAVSNEELAPNSARWTPVNGSIAFQHKRLFNLSVVGVEAKFVRVTFSVEREVGAANFTLALENFEPARRDLFGVYPGAGWEKRNVFGENLALSSAAPLIAALNR